MGHRGRARRWTRAPAGSSSACCVVLALAGLALLAWRRRWEAIAFAIPIATITAIGAVSLAANRRNEILMTLVLPLAAAASERGLDQAGSPLTGRRRGQAAPHPSCM